MSRGITAQLSANEAADSIMASLNKRSPREIGYEDPCLAGAGSRFGSRHPDAGSLYAIQAQSGQNLVKIGHSVNVPSRFRGLKNMSPVPLILIGHYEVVDNDYEIILHEFCQEWRKHGEWFLPTSGFVEILQQWDFPNWDCITTQEDPIGRS